MVELTNFSYSGTEIRTVVKDSGIWFVAKDVCGVLDISVTQCRRLSDKQKGLHNIQTPGGAQQLAVINESGLYKLIFTSRKPNAEKFTDWVTGEVLPSVRKNGAYMTPETIEDVLSNPDVIIDLATRLKNEQQRRKELEVERDTLKPKADRYDEFLDSSGLATLTTVGKQFMNGMTAQQVRKFLQGKGVLYKRQVDGIYPPRDGFKRYFRISSFRKHGNTLGRSVKVTPQGIDLIIDLLAEDRSSLI